MTQIYSNLKNTILLAICLFAFLFLPSSLFSQGTVVGYADGNKYVNDYNLTCFPTNDQMNRFTLVKARILSKY